MGQLRARNSTGPFSWKAALLFVITGGGMIVYFRVEKERLERKRIAEMSKGVGRPKVGGPFTLKDLDGKEFTAEDLKGKYSFVSRPSGGVSGAGWDGSDSVGLVQRLARAMLIGAARNRSTSASRTVPTSVPTSWTKWPRSSTV